jgi:hypothetical protein
MSWASSRVFSGSTPVRVLVYAASAAAFAFPLSTVRSTWAAVFGAALGALAARWLSASSLRSITLAVGAVAAAGVSLAVLHADVLQAWLAAAWGPAGALSWLRDAEFFVGAWWLGLGLAALSMRHRLLSVIEVGFCATAFASLLMGHRHGAINRPFEIADPIIASGGDPTLALLAVGVIAAALTVTVLLRERGLLRSLLHLVVVAALLLLVLKTTRWLGLPEPPAGGGLGLRPDQGQGQQSKQQQGGSRPRSQSNNEDLEFRDDNSPSRNQAPVAVVLLHDDYSPPRGLYYFRQGAFSQYNGRRLVSATRADADQDLVPAFPTAPINIAAAPGGEGMRATLDTTVALLADHARPFALESPVSLKPEPNPDPSRFRRVYRVTSAALTADEYALLGHDVFSPQWSSALRDHYTRGPGDARYDKLAQEILGNVREELRQEPAV